MNLLVDENIKQAIVDHLRLDGNVVWYVVEMEPGVSEDVVLDLANREDALLLTADKDFGELVFRLGRVASGVILVKLGKSPNSNKVLLLLRRSLNIPMSCLVLLLLLRQRQLHSFHRNLKVKSAFFAQRVGKF